MYAKTLDSDHLSFGASAIKLFMRVSYNIAFKTLLSMSVILEQGWSLLLKGSTLLGQEAKRPNLKSKNQ
jgi:hypothetical protein